MYDIVAGDEEARNLSCRWTGWRQSSAACHYEYRFRTDSDRGSVRKLADTPWVKRLETFNYMGEGKWCVANLDR